MRWGVFVLLLVVIALCGGCETTTQLSVNASGEIDPVSTVSVQPRTQPSVAPGPAATHQSNRSTTNASAAVQEPQGKQVIIRDMKFFPREVVVKKGQSVTWKHNDDFTPQVIHMIKIHTENEFSQRMLFGDEYTHVFNNTGRFKFINVIHADDVEPGFVTVTS